MNKIAIAIPADSGYEELWQLQYQNIKEYCDKWNYDLIRISDPTEIGMPFGKMRQLLDILPKYDWVWLRGCDCLITNYNINLESLTDANYDWIIGLDCHEINMDSVLIKNSQWSTNFIKEIVNNHICPDNRWDKDWWSEQKYVIEHRQLDEYKNHIKVIPQKMFNSYWYLLYDRPKTTEGNWTQGDFMIHFPGLDNQRRRDVMNEWLGKVIKDA